MVGSTVIVFLTLVVGSALGVLDISFNPYWNYTDLAEGYLKNLGFDEEYVYAPISTSGLTYSLFKCVGQTFQYESIINEYINSVNSQEKTAPLYFNGVNNNIVQMYNVFGDFYDDDDQTIVGLHNFDKQTGKLLKSINTTQTTFFGKHNNVVFSLFLGTVVNAYSFATLDLLYNFSIPSYYGVSGEQFAASTQDQSPISYFAFTSVDAKDESKILIVKVDNTDGTVMGSHTIVQPFDGYIQTSAPFLLFAGDTLLVFTQNTWSYIHAIDLSTFTPTWTINVTDITHWNGLENLILGVSSDNSSFFIPSEDGDGVVSISVKTGKQIWTSTLASSSSGLFYSVLPYQDNELMVIFNLGTTSNSGSIVFILDGTSGDVIAKTLFSSTLQLTPYFDNVNKANCQYILYDGNLLSCVSVLTN